jgi:hypothetical protein
LTHRPPLRRRLRHAGRRFSELHHELFLVPWRSGLEREARRQRDLLVTLVFIEGLGVENPATFHTLELYPELVEAYHDWHRRQGLEHAEQPGMCC